MKYQLVLSKSPVFCAISIFCTFIACAAGGFNLTAIYDSFRIAAIIAALLGGIYYKTYYQNPGKALLLLAALACLCSNMFSML